LGGIYPDSEKPGFKHIRLRPYFPEGLESFTASHTSPYGQIVSGWTTKGKKVNYEITVPANCTATLELPFGWTAGGENRMELQSGTYRFVCKRK
jgi:alpha-L-rhamnosidase